MSENIEVKLDEVKEVFFLLEELNRFFHAPDRYEDNEKLKDFVSKVYPKIHKGYYKTVWDWLPKEVQDEIAQ